MRVKSSKRSAVRGWCMWMYVWEESRDWVFKSFKEISEIFHGG